MGLGFGSFCMDLGFDSQISWKGPSSQFKFKYFLYYPCDKKALQSGSRLITSGGSSLLEDLSSEMLNFLKIQVKTIT